MPENPKPVRVAVNVMRARLTVIGFNIAIVSFQIVQLDRVSGGLRVPGMDHAVHVGADMALFMALALSLVALVVFIMSGAFDEVGVCTHWTLVAGDLLMYLALAQTAAGFFQPWNAALEIFAAKLSNHATQIASLHAAMVIAGGAGWFLATYAGPAVSLLRSPFPRGTNIVLGIAYLVVLVALAWVSSQAVRVEAAVSGDAPGLIFSVLGELVQPFRW
jgi:hypothetical protein